MTLLLLGNFFSHFFQIRERGNCTRSYLAYKTNETAIRNSIRKSWSLRQLKCELMYLYWLWDRLFWQAVTNTTTCNNEPAFGICFSEKFKLINGKRQWCDTVVIIYTSFRVFINRSSYLFLASPKCSFAFFPRTFTRHVGSQLFCLRHQLNLYWCHVSCGWQFTNKTKR